MPRISADDAGINDVNLTEQSADPTPPASGTQIIYAKSGGVFVEDSAGSVTGPLGAGGGGGDVTGPGSSTNNDIATFSGTTGKIIQDGGAKISDLEHTANKGAANGYAGLNASSVVPIANLATGTPTGSKFIRDDNTLATPAGAGDVVGPGSATDNAVARFDLATGKLIQNSLATIDDSGTVNIPTGQNYDVNGSPHTHAYTARSGSTTDGHLAVWNGANADSIKDGGAIPSVPTGANPTATVGPTATNGSAGTFMRSDGAPALASSLLDAGVNLVVDGGGAVVTNTTKFFFAWPWSGTLTAWDLIADQTGSITFDVKDAAYASFPGSAASLFSTVPALSSAQKNQASSLSIAITKGHWAEVVITGAATVTYCTLALYITRS